MKTCCGIRTCPYLPILLYIFRRIAMLFYVVTDIRGKITKEKHLRHSISNKKNTNCNLYQRNDRHIKFLFHAMSKEWRTAVFHRIL